MLESIIASIQAFSPYKHGLWVRSFREFIHAMVARAQAHSRFFRDVFTDCMKGEAIERAKLTLVPLGLELPGQLGLHIPSVHPSKYRHCWAFLQKAGSVTQE